MSRIHRRLRALAFLFVLFPLWWLQRTHANPMSSDHGGHGHPAKPVQPGGDDVARHGEHDGDDSDDSDDRDDSDDNDDGDDDDGGGGGITDCNNNGIDDASDIANGTSPDANHNGIPDECEFSIKDYCSGIGEQNGGVNCPCGNEVPAGPSGCKNSTGSGASLTATGFALVSNDTLVLVADNIPVGKPAYFLYGTATGPGVTFGDGMRIQSFVRLRKVASSTGHDTFPPPGSLPISQQLGISAGQTTFFQAVYRDHNGPCNTGANATNAIAVFWGP